jgi:succinate dehydrogenase / fumarate reductase flavoprotein subunit
MGGLWVDYHLMSTIPGLFVLGEANFSDHGANRLGASALMQGLSDGYFVIPYTIGHYLAGTPLEKIDTDHSEFRAAEGCTVELTKRLLAMKGKRTPTSLHRELGKIMWDNCGMGRNAAGLSQSIGRIQELREEFWSNMILVGDNDGMNQALEQAGRIADFFELAELMCRDALHREESCGGHFREEYQTPEGEAQRNDADFSYVAAWEFRGVGNEPVLHKEPLTFDYVKPSQRSYK